MRNIYISTTTKEYHELVRKYTMLKKPRGQWSVIFFIGQVKHE